MKPSELRIGNFVNSKLFDTSDIKEINIKAWALEVINPHGNSEGLFWHSEENCEGIPINEEWLLKFGFKKEGKNYVLGEYFLMGHWEHPHNMNYPQTFLPVAPPVCFCIDEEGGIGLRYICYIHELQNLYFALTGNELSS